MLRPVMRMFFGWGLVLAGVASVAGAMPVTIEPDDYADGTVLKTVDPGVTLTVASSSGASLSDTISVTATEVPPLLPKAGTNVFGHANIQFMSDERRLRMDFTNPTDMVGLWFTSTANFVNFAQVGRLEAYDAGNQLVAFYETRPMTSGNSDYMEVVRPTADIAYALAWTSRNEFGLLDTLTYNAIPEPAAALLLVPALAWRHRRTV